MFGLLLLVLAAGVFGGWVTGVIYKRKMYAELPKKKPRLCMFPKYKVRLPVAERWGVEEDLCDVLEAMEFRRVGEKMVFCRGSWWDDLVPNSRKITVIVETPLSNPIDLRVKYGVTGGMIFDTGDLWKFCKKLEEALQPTNLEDKNHVHQGETGNPYQPPTAS